MKKPKCQCHSGEASFCGDCGHEYVCISKKEWKAYLKLKKIAEKTGKTKDEVVG